MSEPQKTAPQVPTDFITKMSFRLCTTCPVKDPHGYFYVGDGKLPVMVIGLRAGRHLLQRMRENNLISAEELTFLTAAIESSGIPETWEMGGHNDVDMVNHMLKRMMGTIEEFVLSILLAAAMSSENEKPDGPDPEPKNQNL